MSKKKNVVADALLAICNKTKKVDYPEFPHELYVRPITMQKMMEIQGMREEGEDEKAFSIRAEAETNAFSLCDKDGNQIFDSEQYQEFVDKCPVSVGFAILEAKLALNSFDSLDVDSKKK